MRWRLWLGVLLLLPFALLVIGTQVAAVSATVGAVDAALGAKARSSAQLERGLTTMQRAALTLDRTWSSPAAAVLRSNPLTGGLTESLSATAHAVRVGSETLDPLGTLATKVLGFDGETPLLSGTTVDTSRLGGLTWPVTELHDDLARTERALAAVPASGFLGRPIGELARAAQGGVHDLVQVTGAAVVAWPTLPQALGAAEPHRYLVCALNDAETFGSGGAPLSAFMVQADRGTITVPISGQLESKLSPDNPPISWDLAGGLPWYREGHQYPFVNSNFHPDFRTASTDMERAWAALGYPAVDGVLTVDVTALSRILEWMGPVDAPGFGQVSGQTLLRTLLIDAYRDFNTPEGVLERHARNDAFVNAVLARMSSPLKVLPALRGALDSIPDRHVQAAFADPGLQEAVASLEATGRLSAEGGDLLGVFSQSGPNKLTVFQERFIDQRVQLQADGGALVRRTVRFANAVPVGLPGDPESYRGYLALKARMRVAYRVPLTATDLTISTGEAAPLVAANSVGPYPDQRGGQVLWQGHDTPQREVTTVVMIYRLPAGTFPPGTYRLAADPQALPNPVRLRVTVTAPVGVDLPATAGWFGSGRHTTWSGDLDQPLTLAVGR